jgi:hypothetical protein
MSKINNLIIEAMEQKPYDMKGTFAELMADKVRHAIEIKKQEVAQKFMEQFDPEDEEVEDEFEEDLGDDSEEETDDTSDETESDDTSEVEGE